MLAFFIESGRMLITDMSGSFQIARILHEVIICATLRKGAVRLGWCRTCECQDVRRDS